MNINELITRLLDNPSARLTDDEANALRQTADQNPAAAALPLALLLKHADNLSADERQQLQNRFAVYASDRQALLALIDPTGDNWANFYPAAPTEAPISTNNVIDTFLDTYGHTSPEEEALLERLIFNPTPDYSQVLAAEAGDVSLPGDADSNSDDARIDAFIRSHQSTDTEGDDLLNEIAAAPAIDQPATLAEPAAPAKEEPQHVSHVNTPEAQDDSLLSESLAKIFIKQGRYERAYEIITNLSLNYPKKSIYFADQLRFLQKLILIQQRSQRSNHDK